MFRHHAAAAQQPSQAQSQQQAHNAGFGPTSSPLSQQQSVAAASLLNTATTTTTSNNLIATTSAATATMTTSTATSINPTASVAAPVVVVEEEPRRNLTKAFEELYVDTAAEDDDDDQPQATPKPASGVEESVISPTGVADLQQDQQPMASSSNPVAAAKQSDATSTIVTVQSLPEFVLHAELQLALTQACVNRVSTYGVIHDVNKEATAMSENDDAWPEENDPLVVAALNTTDAAMATANGKASTLSEQCQAALIDEETWLLQTMKESESTLASSSSSTDARFASAMGEVESKTQLWKPSRSWWEAKSGKNPWMEPASHNKRWR